MADASRPTPSPEQFRPEVDRVPGPRNRDLALRMRLAAGRPVLDLFHAEAKGRRRLNLMVLQELKVAGRHPTLRGELRQALVDHYRSPVGAQERVEGPPWLQDPSITPETIADLLLEEFPED